MPEGIREMVGIQVFWYCNKCKDIAVKYIRTSGAGQAQIHVHWCPVCKQNFHLERPYPYLKMELKERG